MMLVPATPRSSVFKYYPNSASGGSINNTSVIQPALPDIKGIGINKVGTGNVVTDITLNTDDESVLDIKMGNAGNNGKYWGQTPNASGVVQGNMVNVDGIRPSVNATYAIGAANLYYRNGYITSLSTNGIYSGGAGYYIESSKGGALTTIRDASYNVCAISRRLYVGSYTSDSNIRSKFDNYDPVVDIYANYIGCIQILQSSDRNKKNILHKIGDRDISSLSVYKFTYKEDKQQKEHIGFIAQDVKKVIPEAVAGKEGNMMIDYNSIVSVLLEKVKALEERIKVLENGRS